MVVPVEGDGDGRDDSICTWMGHVQTLGKFLRPGEAARAFLGLDFNHGAKGQVIFSRLSKQEGETFTSLSVPIADQA
jgi:hypothetical protein